MSTYWAWWLGAIALAAVTLLYTLATDRSLGVSGMWDRVLHWRTEADVERRDDRFAADADALDAALVAATVQEFGAGSVAVHERPADGPRTTVAGAPVPAAPTRPAPLVTNAALLVSIFVGGLLAAVVSGRFEVRADMGEAFGRIVTDNPVTMIVVLFVGGVLVGFGTRLAGGCSSGHGLSGCGRLRPVSLLATAVFFGTAAAVSFLLWKVI
jgi:hypothetical protein